MDVQYARAFNTMNVDCQYANCIVAVCAVQGFMENHGLSHKDWSCSEGNGGV